MDVLLAQPRARAVEDDSKYIGSSFHGLEPHLRSALQAAFAPAVQPHPSAPPLHALLLCPTPARLEQQLAALERCSCNPSERCASEGAPIRFAACSGQAPEPAHARLCQPPPPLLLTDAATLDLWLMGWAGTALRRHLCSCLRAIVVDAANGCSTLQAAELALLVRRLQALCAQPLVCIGSPQPAGPLQREPLLTHLYALACAESGLADTLLRPEGRAGLDAFVDTSRHALPLRADLAALLHFGDAPRARLLARFGHSLQGLPLPLALRSRADLDAWGQCALQAWAGRLDQALDRWRVLYRSALALLEEATYKVSSQLLSARGGALTCEQRRQDEARQLLRLLCNAGSAGNTDHGSPAGNAGLFTSAADAAGRAEALSDEAALGTASAELHPVRFLAAEGLWPGHDVLRQPVRLWLSGAQGACALIARPRTVALREWGPLALVQHAGRRYRVTQALLPSTAAPVLGDAKLGRVAGCLLQGEQGCRERCPVSGLDLYAPGASERLHDLLELAAARAEEMCADAAPEDGPLNAPGFDIQHCFSLDEGTLCAVQQAMLKSEGRTLLALHALPGVRLVAINRRWHGHADEGFSFDLDRGAWSAAEPAAASTRQRRVRPWTALRTDAVLLRPAPCLGLRQEDGAALQQRLLHAATRVLGAAAGELAAVHVGEGEGASCLLYEAAGPGAGLVSRLLAPATWQAVMAQVRALHRDAPDAPSLAAVLDRLHAAVLECPGRAAEEDYEARYARLRQQLDPADHAGHRFLAHLHAQRLRLPDAVRRRVPGLYLQPDFYFEPRTWIFCEGGQSGKGGHVAAQERTATVETLLARGDEVWHWQAGDDLAVQVAQRPDLFHPVR